MKASTIFHAPGPANGLWCFRFTENYVVAANPTTVFVHDLTCANCKAHHGDVCTNHHAMFEVGQIWDAEVHPQSELLLTAHKGPQGKIGLWNLEDGSHIKDFDGGSPISIVRFLTADSDSSFASAFEDGTIRLWKRTQDAPVHVLRGHTGPITRMITYPDGTRLISASRDGTTRIWDTETGKQLYSFETFSDYRVVLNLSPDLSRLRTACAMSGELCIWNLDDGSLISKLDPSQTGGVRMMSQITDRDGKMVTCGLDSSIRTWTQDGSALTTLAVRDEHEPIRGVVYIGEKLAVVAGSLGGWVQMWDWENQVPLFELEEPLQMVYDIISDGKKVGVTSHERLPGPVESDAPRDWVSAVTSRIQVWDMEDIRKAAGKDQ